MVAGILPSRAFTRRPEPSRAREALAKVGPSISLRTNPDEAELAETSDGERVAPFRAMTVAVPDAFVCPVRSGRDASRPCRSGCR